MTTATGTGQPCVADALAVAMADRPMTEPTDRSNWPQVSGTIDARAATAITDSLPRMLRTLATEVKVPDVGP